MIDLAVEQDIRRVIQVMVALSCKTSRPAFVDEEVYSFVLERGYAVVSRRSSRGYAITRRGREFIWLLDKITEEKVSEMKMTFVEYKKGLPPKTPEEEALDMRILAYHAGAYTLGEWLDRKKAELMDSYGLKPDDVSPESMRARFPGMYWEGEYGLPPGLEKALEEKRGSTGDEDAPSRRSTKRRKRPSPR